MRCPGESVWQIGGQSPSSAAEYLPARAVAWGGYNLAGMKVYLSVVNIQRAVNNNINATQA